MNLIVIPADLNLDPYEVTTDDAGFYDCVSGIVGGLIQALPFEQHHPRATAYINEEGKFDPQCEPNPRATALVNLFPGGYIAGEFVIAGLDFNTGESEGSPLSLEQVEGMIG